jgi:hypothetical protein
MESSTSWEDDNAGSIALHDAWLDKQEARRNFRTELWTTKDGQVIPIKDMGDRHLFNAYCHSQDSLLFREMVLRLFEAKLKEKNT